jgi:ketosteroid isomerase-like protein
MADQPGLGFIEAMERAVMTGDVQEAACYLDEAVVYTVGALRPVSGIAAILAYVERQSRLARWDGHTLRGDWPIADGLVVEVESHFTRIRDGRRLTLPCVDIYRFRHGRIADWRVYADLSIFGQED